MYHMLVSKRSNFALFNQRGTGKQARSVGGSFLLRITYISSPAGSSYSNHHLRSSNMLLGACFKGFEGIFEHYEDRCRMVQCGESISFIKIKPSFVDRALG